MNRTQLCQTPKASILTSITDPQRRLHSIICGAFEKYNSAWAPSGVYRKSSTGDSLCTWGWEPPPPVILLGQGVLRLAVHRKCGDAG